MNSERIPLDVAVTDTILAFLRKIRKKSWVSYTDWTVVEVYLVDLERSDLDSTLAREIGQALLEFQALLQTIGFSPELNRTKVVWIAHTASNNLLNRHSEASVDTPC